jgi:hypothetical protein
MASYDYKAVPFLKTQISNHIPYSTLRDIGFVNLPSTRTLYDYSHCVKSGTGFRAEITNQLITEIHSKSFTDNWQQYVGLLHDEIKIKADLVYNKHSGELIGFMNLDDVGNAVLNMEQNMDEQRPQELAKYVLVLFVRGIATDLQFPLAHFATGGISADILYPIIWEALEILEVTVGLKVLFITCDGASPNRRFFKLHQLPQQINDSTVYCTDNPFAVGENRYLFFISDVPHLIKTIRNCFANSYSHNKTRKLWNEKDVSWMQIVDLYEECTLGIYNLCPKLTRSHIDLTAYSCMKVRLAAQVLSDTVAFALCQLRGDEIGATVKFIRKMNKFFDCLNTRNLYEGRNTRNPNLAPYTAIDDAWLTWLIDDFLKYFDDWKVAVENRPGQFSKSEKSAMMLSYQTLEGFQITAKSIVACVKYMLNLGTPFILTEVFNQDVLEQHFGHHRGRCGSNTNPTLSDMDNNMTHLRVIGSQAVSGASGNTRHFNRNRTIDNTPLLRRPRNN